MRFVFPSIPYKCILVKLYWFSSVFDIFRVSASQFCIGAGKICLGTPLKPAETTSTGPECSRKCSRTDGCQSAHFKDWKCTLRGSRCSEEQLNILPGGTQYYRLSECNFKQISFIVEWKKITCEISASSSVHINVFVSSLHYFDKK